MLSGTNRTHAGTTATMRDGKGFMQIYMNYISTKVSGIAKPDHCIEVGTIHIYLTAIFMYDITHFTNCLFKNTVCRRICNHKRS